MDFISDFADDYRLSVYDALDSTNSQALRFAKEEDVGHHWVTANTQSAGRGRSGRSWYSGATGNLYASLLLKLNCSVATASQLALLAGLAAFDTIELLSEKKLSSKLCLKWPNDLLLEHAKLGGILLESQSLEGGDGSELLYVVIGIGLNLSWSPELENRKTTNLNAYDVAISPKVALEHLAKVTSKWLKIWNNGEGFKNIRIAWIARTQAIGSPLQVHVGNKIMHGVFSGLNDQGGLMLTSSDGEVVHIQAGDVFQAEELDLT